MSPRAGSSKKVARAVREAEMLEAAGRVFAEHGFHRASMVEIAQGSGISKPMLYRYFGSKEGLYSAYVTHTGNQMLARMDAAVSEAEGPPEQRLWAGALAFFGHVDDNRDSWTVLFREQAGSFEREIAAIRRQVVEGTMELLDEALGLADGKPGKRGIWTEPLAHAFVGASESLANWWIDHPRESREAMAARLMDVAWLGLAQRLRRGESGWAGLQSKVTRR